MRDLKSMIPYFVLNQFNLGPLTLYTWGLFVGLGFSAGYLLLLYLAKKKNLAPEKMAGLALSIFFGGVLGAKTLPVALLPGGFFNNISLLFSQHSGAAFMGGLVGAMLFGAVYIKLAKLPSFAKASEGENFWEIADLLVLPTVLGITIGRIGCILINDHQGAVTNLPWGILWPDGIIRHPVGIYESLVGLGLLIVFWWMRKKILAGKNNNVIPAKAGIQTLVPGSRLTRLDSHARRARREAGMTKRENNGQLFLLFLLVYSLIRFFLEFTRVASGHLADPRWGIFSVSQWVALFLLCFVVVFLARRIRYF